MATYIGRRQVWDSGTDSYIADPDNTEDYLIHFADVGIDDNAPSADASGPLNDAVVFASIVGEDSEGNDRYVAKVVPVAQAGFWAIIGSNSADGTNRKNYDWTEAELTAAGYDNWSTKSGGLSGSSARNTLENMNSGAGVQGNGVDVANLDTDDFTFPLQACPAGAVVWMRPVVETATNTTTYWFEYANGVDGSCD